MGSNWWYLRRRHIVVLHQNRWVLFRMKVYLLNSNFNSWGHLFMCCASKGPFIHEFLIPYLLWVNTIFLDLLLLLDGALWRLEIVVGDSILLKRHVVTHVRVIHHIDAVLIGVLVQHRITLVAVAVWVRVERLLNLLLHGMWNSSCHSSTRVDDLSRSTWDNLRRCSTFGDLLFRILVVVTSGVRVTILSIFAMKIWLLYLNLWRRYCSRWSSLSPRVLLLASLAVFSLSSSIWTLWCLIRELGIRGIASVRIWVYVHLVGQSRHQVVVLHDDVLVIVVLMLISAMLDYYLPLTRVMLLLSSWWWLSSSDLLILLWILLLKHHRLLPSIHLLRMFPGRRRPVWVLIAHSHLCSCHMHFIVLFLDLLFRSVTVPASLTAYLWLIDKASVVILRQIIISLHIVLSLKLLHIVLIPMHLLLLLVVLLLLVFVDMTSLISAILLILHF